MSAIIVSVHHLVRCFGARRALDEVDFELVRGQVLALVGPNGSGKTTLLKILAGFLRPTSGNVHVFGHDPYRERATVMTRARFAFAPPALYSRLSGREILRALSSIESRRQHVSEREINGVLELVGLFDRADDRVGIYSLGMQQRLTLAQALLPMPELLVLDEPTDGLDPVAVLELREVLTRLSRDRGVTILLASHLMIEVERLADSLVLLHEGRRLYYGSPQDLQRGHQRLCLVIDGTGAEIERAVKCFRDAGIEPQYDGDARLFLPSGSISLNEAALLLAIADVSLAAFYEDVPTLETAVLEFLRAGTGRGITTERSTDGAARENNG